MKDGLPSLAIGRRFYKSSTPLIVVIKYLQALRRLGFNQDEQILPPTVKDSGFCVSSDPKFLQLIVKLCLRWKVFLDLAVHCSHIYQQYTSYNKNFNPDWQCKVTRNRVLMVLALQTIGEPTACESEVIKQIISSELPGLKRVEDWRNQAQPKKLAPTDFFQLETLKILTKVLKSNQTLL